MDVFIRNEDGDVAHPQPICQIDRPCDAEVLVRQFLSCGGVLFPDGYQSHDISFQFCFNEQGSFFCEIIVGDQEHTSP